MAEAARTTARRAHLIVGGFPRGALAGHDMDYARLRLLGMLADQSAVTTVANDFADIETALRGVQSLVTYVAGPFPDATQNAAIEAWLADGGRWFALHGTSGGKAARLPNGPGRSMVKMAHHKTLGGFFLNHPPLRKFTVNVATDHPLTQGLPASFEVADELYLIEPQGDKNETLLTTELEKDPSPPGFGFAYEADTSVQADGKTRLLGYTRQVGNGGVTYIALGHCHSPTSNLQPFVDDNLGGDTPPVFRGSWETAPFQKLVSNVLAWSLDPS